MTRERGAYVLDSFALLALFRAEPGADAVARLLRRAQRGDVRLSMTVVNLGEVVYRTILEQGLARADEVLARVEELPITLVPVDWELAMAAAHIKGSYRIAYADCLAGALAQREGAVLVTGDPEFRQIERLIRIDWLPRANST